MMPRRWELILLAVMVTGPSVVVSELMVNWFPLTEQ